MGDVFVAKLDAAGNHVWSKRFGDAANQMGRVIEFDAAGNVLVGGWFEGTLDCGAGALPLGGLRDGFILKLDTDGSHVWSKSVGDANQQYVWALAADAGSNVLVAGSFEGTVDFGDGALTSAGSSDVFVAKLDTTGTAIWSKRFGGLAIDGGNAIAIDPVGNLLLFGGFQGPADFGTGTITGSAFAAKLDPTGTMLWSRGFDSIAARSVAVDGISNVFLTGWLSGTVDFGGGPLISAGMNDIFVAKLAP